MIELKSLVCPLCGLWVGDYYKNNFNVKDLEIGLKWHFSQHHYQLELDFNDDSK